MQFETHEMYRRYKGPFRLCSSCQEEYDEYLLITKEGGESPYYWHNKEWRQVWESWLNYQRALKNYGDSAEFLELVREVEWEK
jgi:hypothetical protein